jgi:hypothetical protein
MMTDDARTHDIAGADDDINPADVADGSTSGGPDRPPEDGSAGSEGAVFQTVPVERLVRHDLDPVRLSPGNAKRARADLQAGWRPRIAGYFCSSAPRTRFVAVLGGCYVEALGAIDPAGRVTVEVWSNPSRAAVLAELGVKELQLKYDKFRLAALTAELVAKKQTDGSAEPQNAVAQELHRSSDSVRNYQTLYALGQRFGRDAVEGLAFNLMPKIRHFGVDAFETTADLAELTRERTNVAIGQELGRTAERLAAAGPQDRERMLDHASERAGAGANPVEARQMLQWLEHFFEPQAPEADHQAGTDGRRGRRASPVDETRDLGHAWPAPRPDELCERIFQTFQRRAAANGRARTVKAFCDAVNTVATAHDVVDPDRAYLSAPRLSNLRHRDPARHDRAHQLRVRELAVVVMTIDDWEPVVQHATAYPRTRSHLRGLLDAIRALGGDPSAMSGYAQLPSL